MPDTDYRLKYILVGASGSGKSTMASVLEQYLGLKRCITSTTRPPRPGEVNGRDYHFEKQLDPDNMFEHATFGGHEYGICREELAHGDFIILDPQGVAYYRENYPAPLTVIQLIRSGIDVDANRMARDRDAGFDQVEPDVIVRGETVDEMASNLITYMQRNENCYFQEREGRAMNEFETKFFEAGARDANEAQGITYSMTSKRFDALRKELGVLPDDPRGRYIAAYDTGVVFEINCQSGLDLPVPDINATDRHFCVNCGGEDFIFSTPGTAKDFAARSGCKFYIASAIPEKEKSNLPSLEDKLSDAFNRSGSSAQSNNGRAKEPQLQL